METYIFLPLYNVFVDKNIINQEFNGFRIINNDVFVSEYEKLLTSSINTQFLRDLKEDIRKPYKGELYTKEYAQYILCKKAQCFYPKNIQDKKENVLFRQEINNIKIEFEKIILSARLLKAGRIQIHNGYFFSPMYYSSFQLHSSTSIEHIRPWFYSEKSLNELYYDIDKITLINLIKNINMLNIIDDKKLVVPILYFINYYSVTNLFDRIIKLGIILESTMLADCNDELKHKLRTRTCSFLSKDVDNILSVFYDVRSAIVHNGDISKSLYKKIKNTLNYEYKTDVEILFYFIQKGIEPIVREVLYKSINIFNDSETIRNYSQLASEIDKNIITKVTTS